ncbi:MAG: hypothetical protein ACE5NC_08940 [Anaerolineae bacterium]
MNQKGFSTIIVGIIAIVILITLGGYFLLTQNQETPKTTENNNMTDTSIIDCGVEDNQHGDGYNKQARDCFFEAYSTCTPATFVGTRYSIEGGRFISTLTITGEKDGKCEIFKELDASDYWALGKKLDGYCYGLESVDILSPEDKNQLFFELKECDDSLEGQIIT